MYLKCVCLREGEQEGERGERERERETRTRPEGGKVKELLKLVMLYALKIVVFKV